MELRRTVAVITGATSGIGEATARALAAHGVRLIITGRREDRLRDLTEKLDGCAAVVGDVLDPEMPNRLRDAALETYGRLDIAINNAGVAHYGTIESVDLERVAQMVRINVEAAFRFAYTMLRHFKQQDSGHLVNMSSAIGTKMRETAGPYGGTKHAIEALTEALRLELAKTNVGITAIQPGIVATEIFDNMANAPISSVAQPLRPEDIANTILMVLQQPAHIRIPKLMILPKDHAI